MLPLYLSLSSCELGQGLSEMFSEISFLAWSFGSRLPDPCLYSSSSSYTSRPFSMPLHLMVTQSLNPVLNVLLFVMKTHEQVRPWSVSKNILFVPSLSSALHFLLPAVLKINENMNQPLHSPVWPEKTLCNQHETSEKLWVEPNYYIYTNLTILAFKLPCMKRWER